MHLGPAQPVAWAAVSYVVTVSNVFERQRRGRHPQYPLRRQRRRAGGHAAVHRQLSRPRLPDGALRHADAEFAAAPSPATASALLIRW